MWLLETKGSSCKKSQPKARNPLQRLLTTLGANVTLGERPGAGVVGALEERPRAIPPPALALHPLRCLLANPRDCLAVLLRSLFRLA